MCFWLQPCRCPKATINLISVPEKGGESPVWCLPAWDYHPPHTPFPKPKSPSSHAWIVTAPAPPGSSFLHPAAPALLCSVHCLHSDPLTTEVRSCHAPAPALQASCCARDPIRPECGPQSPTWSGPGSFSFVSCHCPAPDASPPSSSARFSLRLCSCCFFGLEGSTSRPLYSSFSLFLQVSAYISLDQEAVASGTIP